MSITAVAPMFWGSMSHVGRTSRVPPLSPEHGADNCIHLLVAVSDTDMHVFVILEGHSGCNGREEVAVSKNGWVGRDSNSRAR
mgnify:CR=1 FL=1|jgi:hypothetical protein